MLVVVVLLPLSSPMCDGDFDHGGGGGGCGGRWKTIYQRKRPAARALMVA
jgi:hypothetical protein